MQLPEIVDEERWERSHEELLAKEKEQMRAADALAAERRRQPMLEIPAHHRFEGPEGTRTLAELFEGRPQLAIYHFMFQPGGEPCGGCSMFADQICELAHLHARDVTVAFVSPAGQDEIQAYRRRMGWQVPWYTPLDGEFQRSRGVGGGFKLDVYLRAGERVFLTYSTQSRGVEAVGSVWSFLDRTPLGRQEHWEDSPEGRPQEEPYQWWRKHDEYEPAPSAGSAAR